MSDKIYDIVILGAGPAGIATAYEAELLGLKNIIILEKTDSHSHTIKNFYEAGKGIDRDWGGFEVELLGNMDFKFFKEHKIDLFDKILKKSNIIKTVYNSEVYLIEKKNSLFNIESKSGKYRAKNVVVAIGRMAKPKKPDYKLPRKLAKRINFDISKVTMEEKIIVVGGGDSAAEYAYSLSKNNNVTISYRKDVFTRPNPINIQKLQDKFNSNELKAKLGVDIEEIQVSEDKRVQIIFTDTTTEIYDRMIFALGGTTPIDFIQNCGITIDEKLQPIYDKNNETNIKNLFVTGDIVYENGGSISMAFNQGYIIAKHLGRNVKNG